MCSLSHDGHIYVLTEIETFGKRLHATIKYTFDLAVRNVELSCHGGAYVSFQILLKLIRIAGF